MQNNVKHLAKSLAKSQCEILRFTQDDTITKESALLDKCPKIWGELKKCYRNEKKDKYKLASMKK